MISIILIDAANPWSHRHMHRTLVKYAEASAQGIALQVLTVLGDVPRQQWLEQIHEQLCIINELALEKEQECTVLIHMDVSFDLEFYKRLEAYLHKLTRLKGIFTPQICVEIMKKCYPPGTTVGVIGGSFEPEMDIYTHLLIANGFEPMTLQAEDICGPVHSCEVMILACCDEQTSAFMNSSYKGTTILVDPARVSVESLLQQV